MRPPAPQIPMALPLTLRSLVPLPHDLWMLMWMRAWRSFIAACQVRVAVGVWWRRLHRGDGISQQTQGNELGHVDSQWEQPHDAQGSSLCETSEWQRTSLSIPSGFDAHLRAPRILMDAPIYNGHVRMPRGRQKSYGRLPQVSMGMDHETRRSYMALRLHQTRAAPAALSALQTTLHLPYGWDVAEIPRHGGLRGRYTRELSSCASACCSISPSLV